MDIDEVSFGGPPAATPVDGPAVMQLGHADFSSVGDVDAGSRVEEASGLQIPLPPAAPAVQPMSVEATRTKVKRNQSAFMFFSAERRDTLKVEFAGQSMGEVAKVCCPFPLVRPSSLEGLC